MLKITVLKFIVNSILILTGRGKGSQHVFKKKKKDPGHLYSHFRVSFMPSQKSCSIFPIVLFLCFTEDLMFYFLLFRKQMYLDIKLLQNFPMFYRRMPSLCSGHCASSPWNHLVMDLQIPSNEIVFVAFSSLDTFWRQGVQLSSCCILKQAFRIHLSGPCFS